MVCSEGVPGTYKWLPDGVVDACMKRTGCTLSFALTVYPTPSNNLRRLFQKAGQLGGCGWIAVDCSCFCSTRRHRMQKDSSCDLSETFSCWVQSVVFFCVVLFSFAFPCPCTFAFVVSFSQLPILSLCLFLCFVVLHIQAEWRRERWKKRRRQLRRSSGQVRVAREPRLAVRLTFDRRVEAQAGTLSLSVLVLGNRQLWS